MTWSPGLLLATGTATACAIETLQERSVIFVEPAGQVYTDQIVGENSRGHGASSTPPAA